MPYYGRGAVGSSQFHQLGQGFLVAETVEVLPRLNKRDHIFAAQMVKFYDEFGKLSARQEAVLREILLRAPTQWIDNDDCYRPEAESAYR
ncbi:MAG: hypothetical protein EBW74_13035 [Betaproteobacteria bacterium]|nr:hypothetical protein [Betaproteobacteria bacterium]